MADRYPGYDVLTKRNSVSWNEQTRAVIDERLAIDPQKHQFFTDEEWATMCAVCARIVPQPASRESPAPVAAMVDEKLHGDGGDGYRDARLPPMREAWRRGLAAIDAEAKLAYGRGFHQIGALLQDDLLTAIQNGALHGKHWHDLPPQLFFQKRVLHDIVSAYYAHPAAWNEIGFGGPASPRGYVRMNFDRRDPWEASEARPGREAQARAENTRVG
ncbi:MAG: gluconate 2-dehydrogenase subunit 3 family protein [Xanthobacteraceae bacterium]